MEMESVPQNLRQALDAAFSLEELKTICFDLNVECENFLPTKGEVIRELVKKLHRENRLIKLIELCEKERAQYSWYDLMEEYILENKPDKISDLIKREGILLIIIASLLIMLFAISAPYVVIGGVTIGGIVIIIIILLLDED